MASTVRPCKGGQVHFGVSGNSAGIYLTKFQLCISAFQDERYGKGNRLHTVSGKADNTTPFRCTVCGFGNGICRH